MLKNLWTILGGLCCAALLAGMLSFYVLLFGAWTPVVIVGIVLCGKAMAEFFTFVIVKLNARIALKQSQNLGD